ncbi:Dna Topoisomerase 3-Alpha [Manis pentadactyla]|nr:Dna Topoisomerase 3-Alpha [Manis pentadactyla]
MKAYQSWGAKVTLTETESTAAPEEWPRAGDEPTLPLLLVTVHASCFLVWRTEYKLKPPSAFPVALSPCNRLQSRQIPEYKRKLLSVL